MKPFYCFQPSEKAKYICLRINCLNSYVILNFINGYRLSQKLALHDLPTCYLNKLKSGEGFQEMEAENICKCYESKWVVGSYIWNYGKPADNTRRTLWTSSFVGYEITRFELETILRHATYLDNWNSVFPLTKKVYNGKYTELDFF